MLHRTRFTRSPALLALLPALFAMVALNALDTRSAHAQDAAPLPNAPVPVSRPAHSYSAQPYQKPTPLEDLVAYRRELIGPRPFVAAAFRSGIEQIRPVPIGWGQDFPGYLQRYGSAYGEAAIDSSVRFGLAAAFHEDVRYLVCHQCSAGAKFQNAVLAEVSARHGDDGHRLFSATPIIAGFSGPLVAYNAWYPPGYTSQEAARHAALGFSTRIVFHLLREFLFDKKP